MPDGLPTYQVVTYDDARQLVGDAVEGEKDSTRDLLEGVSTGAQAGTVADVLSGTRSIVEDSADLYATRTVQMLTGTTDGADDGSDMSLSVTLNDEQWRYLHDALAVQSTGAVLSLLLLSMVLGALVARYFVDGWRR